MYSKYTFKELIAELKKLKVIIFTGGKKLLTEVSKSQKIIFNAMEMKVPRLS